MNDDIKQGATQLAQGLKTEAKEVSEKAFFKFKEIKTKLDTDSDGKVEFQEVKKTAVSEVREGLDKLKALLKDDDVPLKTKVEIAEIVDKLKPAMEAAKMEAQIAAEKVKAELEHKKEIGEIKEQVKEEN